MFAGLSAVTRGATDDLVAVVVTTRLVPAGMTVGADDLAVTQVPAAVAPDGVLTQTQDAVGKVAGTGLRKGQMLTDMTLVGGSASDGSVVLSIKLDNPELAALAPPGTRITLFTTTSSEPVASHILVVAAPVAQTGGILGGTASAVLLVRVSPEEAGRLARAMSSSTLTLAIG